MRHINFDERLDGIMARAVIRLQERMQLAYNRGRLREYLERIDFANDIDPKTIDSGSLIELQDQAVVLLAVKMRRARRAGYLKDFLKQINMLELLMKEKDIQKKVQQDIDRGLEKRIRRANSEAAKEASAVRNEPIRLDVHLRERNEREREEENALPEGNTTRIYQYRRPL